MSSDCLMGRGSVWGDGNILEIAQLLHIMKVLKCHLSVHFKMATSVFRVVVCFTVIRKRKSKAGLAEWPAQHPFHREALRLRG